MFSLFQHLIFLIGSSDSASSEILDFNPNGFVWPIPGYTRISSFFGKRDSPTSGASSSHSGIDIPAPEGTHFIAVADGEITFRDFLVLVGIQLRFLLKILKLAIVIVIRTLLYM